MSLYDAKTESIGKSDDDSGGEESEPLAWARRRIKNRGESVRMSKGVFRTEPAGRDGRTYKWRPSSRDGAWTEFEPVFSKRALRKFEQSGIYEVAEENPNE